MKPGRELDMLIAENVMGETLEEELGYIDRNGNTSFGNSPEYTRQKCENYARQGLGTKLITRKMAAKAYSTDIAAAWEVVEKIPRLKNKDTQSWGELNNCEDGFPFMLKKTPNGWEAGWEGAYWAQECFAEALTAPHVICLAALKAVEK